MKIKSIIGIDECSGCSDYCCRFEESGWDAAPVFLAEERETIEEEIRGKDYLKPFGDTIAWQVVLKKGSGENEYFCPFFDQGKRMCSIQAKKPFDCLFFPLAFMRGQNQRGIYVSCFKEHICPGLAKAGKEKIDDYKKYIKEVFSSPEGRGFALNYPQILDYDDDAELIFKIE